MDEGIEKLFDDAIFIARTLFNRNKVTGSTANMSFINNNNIYITGTGTCFGNLFKKDFSVNSFDGSCLYGPMPSKELKLHKIMYDEWEDVKAIIHCHSFYSTLWSCLNHRDFTDVVPMYTPYLEMKIGKVCMVPYAPPGSEKLFGLFRENIHLSRGILLQNHGVIVGGKDLLGTFYILEELEESLKIAWNLKTNQNLESNIINNL